MADKELLRPRVRVYAQNYHLVRMLSTAGEMIREHRDREEAEAEEADDAFRLRKDAAIETALRGGVPGVAGRRGHAGGGGDPGAEGPTKDLHAAATAAWAGEVDPPEHRVWEAAERFEVLSRRRLPQVQDLQDLQERFVFARFAELAAASHGRAAKFLARLRRLTGEPGPAERFVAVCREWPGAVDTLAAVATLVPCTCQPWQVVATAQRVTFDATVVEVLAAAAAAAGEVDKAASLRALIAAPESGSGSESGPASCCMAALHDAAKAAAARPAMEAWQLGLLAALSPTERGAYVRYLHAPPPTGATTDDDAGCAVM